MKKVKDWLKSKRPQFSIVDRNDGGKIIEVFHLKVGHTKTLWSGWKLNRDFYFGIIHFHEDLIHVTFVLVIPKINPITGEVDSLDTTNEFKCEMDEYGKKISEITSQQNTNYFKNANKEEE